MASPRRFDPVVRGKVKRETLHGWRQVGHDRLGRPIWDWVVEPESGIAYIAIREFVDDTGRRFRQALVDAARELSSFRAAPIGWKDS